jgi:Family of unknown function (DUF6325)
MVDAYPFEPEVAMTIGEQQEANGSAPVDELGPIDVVVLAYPPDAPMTGEAAPILMDLVERGIVRIFDVLFVMKAEDGSVVGFEAKDLAGKNVGEFHVFEGASSGLLGDADAQQAAESLEPGWSAAVILYENRWAAPFVAAVRRNGGEALDAHRISPEELMEVLEATEA